MLVVVIADCYKQGYDFVSKYRDKYELGQNPSIFSTAVDAVRLNGIRAARFVVIAKDPDPTLVMEMNFVQQFSNATVEYHHD